MQKALTQMNIQLANVISDVAGVTGLAIMREIVGGERDVQVLAAYRDRRIKADEEEIAKSLQGNWRAEHLFGMCSRGTAPHRSWGMCSRGTAPHRSWVPAGFLSGLEVFVASC